MAAMFSDKGITFIGMPGSGKSTIGRLIANSLDMEFIDLDEVMEKCTSIKPFDYINKYGEPAVLELEERETLKLNLTDKVFSPGGSIIYKKPAIDKIKRETIVVFLKVPKEILRERIKNIDTRGVVGLKEHGFDKLFDQRTLQYKEVADIVVEIEEETENEVKEEILKKLSN